jgi:hypothetical protein
VVINRPNLWLAHRITGGKESYIEIDRYEFGNEPGRENYEVGKEELHTLYGYLSEK